MMLRTMLPVNTAAEQGSPTAPATEISAKEATPPTLAPDSRNPASPQAAKENAKEEYCHSLSIFIFIINYHLAKYTNDYITFQAHDMSEYAVRYADSSPIFAAKEKSCA
ncbi:hypothetical protein [Ruminococcus flavefaciens]|uniref:hypothetical protein n=1 Tax=Ruminococcus flavefaciens TaxID=1265 RepID=UPI001A9A5C63|nr:hypothetical protein [Ruminococcus flavefaciens]